jgi:hypothetical protein
MVEKKTKKPAKKLEVDTDPNVLLGALSEGMKQMLGGLEDLGLRMGGVESSVKKNAEEIEKVKNGDKDAFKRDAKAEDIEAVAENRKGIDPKIVSIVDETVGTDFGVEVTAAGENQMGYMFTLIVPDRLNDNEIEQRPIKAADGTYKHDTLGNVIMENYQRPDRRSRMLATADGYSAIREHCEKVRAYMHAYYTALKKPMPTLKVK